MVAYIPNMVLKAFDSYQGTASAGILCDCHSEWPQPARNLPLHAEEKLHMARNRAPVRMLSAHNLRSASSVSPIAGTWSTS